MRSFFALLLLSHASTTVWSQTPTYSFTRIAESNEAARFIASLTGVSNRGSVAYNAVSFTPRAGLPPLGALEAYVWEGGVSRRLGESAPLVTAYDINADGIVVFGEAQLTGLGKLRLDRHGEVTDLVNTETGEFAAIHWASLNNRGDVVFSAIKDTGAQGIYVISASGEMRTVLEGLELGTFLDMEPCINDDGVVSFASGSVFVIPKDQPPINLTNGEFGRLPVLSSYSSPRINSAGQVVFTLVVPLPPFLPTGAVLRSNPTAGAPEVVAQGVGPAPLMRAATINERGDIAYTTTLVSATPPLIGTFAEIYVVKAGSNTPVRVIRTGDAFLGSLAGSVGMPGVKATSRYLNDSGLIAFPYTLLDGRSGIALATPN